MSFFTVTDASVMPFGLHKGKRVGDVPANYLLWLLDEDWARKQWPDLIAYIRKNKTALEMDAVQEAEENGLDDPHSDE